MRELARRLALHPEELPTVEWRDLERILRETFEGIGFDTKLTRSTKDGGFDLELTIAEKDAARVNPAREMTMARSNIGCCFRRAACSIDCDTDRGRWVNLIWTAIRWRCPSISV